MRDTSAMMRLPVLLFSVTAVCDAILPEIVYPAVGHILEDHSVQVEHTEPSQVFVEEEQRPEAPRHQPEDETQQVGRQGDNNSSVSQRPDSNGLLQDHHYETTSNKAIENETVNAHIHMERETNNISASTFIDSELGNSIDYGCITDEDCGKGRYCLNVMHSSKCLQCKAIDVPCTKDKECCGDQLCVWGQCSANATKGEAGSTCHYQTDCNPDLCCALHKVLLFPVCLAKPIERELCFDTSNHLVELLSLDSQEKGPRKHCPCAGDLHCTHLGRGSMCLTKEDSSEEDMADTLYSEIDYII